MLKFGQLYYPTAIQGKNVDPGFRMRVRMTQLPRLPSPASAEFRNFVSGEVEATEWNCET